MKNRKICIPHLIKNTQRNNNKKYRLTKQKQIIQEIIMQTKDIHFTVKDIQKNIENKNVKMAFSSIYNIVNELEEENYLIKTPYEDSFMYCLNINNHYHERCIKCKKIFPVYYDKKIPKIEIKTESISRYNLLEIYGICKKCLHL